MCRKLNWWYVHCALGMMRENRLGSPVELQVLPGQVQELQETISNLVLPNALGRGRIEVELLHSMVHSLRRVQLLVWVQAHLVAHQQEVLAQGKVLQHVLQDVQMLR